jgi:hypothetical protein
MTDARVLGGAAGLKFQHPLPRVRARSFRPKSGTAVMDLASAVIAKFA